MKVDPFWASIAAKAATIDERLSGKYIPDRNDDEARSATQSGLDDAHQGFLQQWCEFASNGDKDLFTRRLARDGLKAIEVVPYLGDVVLRPGEDAPEWIDTARWVFDAIISGGDEATGDCPADIRNDVPFADLIWPVVIAARARVSGFDAAVLGADAKVDLDRILILRLAKVYTHTLYESFESFRQAVGIKPEDTAGPEVYDAFTSALRSGPFANLVSNRPVMIRLLATIVDQWIATTGEFIDRLRRDIAAFRDHFPELQDISLVRKITGGISDAHNHGRSVLILEFDTGTKIVYKPRPIGAEQAWKGLSDWLIKSGSDIRLGAAQTWCRPDYGWMAYVDHDTALSSDQAPVFYRASGQLLALLYCLKGSDMHHENFLIADGRPVAIDLETLFQPELRHLPGGTKALHAKELATHNFGKGVIAVGLLAQRKNIVGHWVDDGGLATSVPKPVRDVRLVNVNQGNMVFETVTVEKPLSGLGITIDGQPADAADYVADLIDGFCDTINFLSDNSAAFLGKDGPLGGFRDVRIRHVLRPTAYYQELEYAIRTPQNQQDGFVWSLNFERLARRARWDLDDYPGWGILAHERTALTRMDVPLFTGKTDQDGVWADGVLVSTDFTASAVLPRISDRLDHLKANLEYDCAIIRQLVLSTRFTDLPARRPWADTPLCNDIAATARQSALSIARYIADQAILCDGAACWMTADATPDGEALQIAAMGEQFYEGTSGVALFFAGCHAVDPDGEWKTLSLAALEAPRARTDQLGSIGGFEGIGGLVYVLVRCADLLDAPELLEEAVRMSERIDDAAVHADKALDVISGVSGAILGLLALYRATGDQAVLDRAIMCGRHLPEDPAAWIGVGGRALAGISHGAAGSVLALLKLYQACGDKAFLNLAKRGLAFERSLFDPVENGWPDLRGEKPVRDPVQWCHGAVGIGFARMATLDVLDDPTIRDEIETAIAAALAKQDGGRDNLCCGHAGRFSMLRYALELGCGQDDLEHHLNHRLSAWINRLDHGDTVGMMARDRVFQTGLMQGLPGIGQALLEIAAPGKIRPVLILA
ncbi:MAG: type 2 lanthipeptide synthetase LanM [Thalassospira sp.]|uniref:type 2 lanthipeptide synthetase LanM n=1 Tax=Thalassospira sp. TaxID=1912094 RepID=UPI0032EEE4D1